MQPKNKLEIGNNIVLCLDRCLGSGTYGDVYYGYDKSKSYQPCAIKRIARSMGPRALELYVRELQANWRLRHPNIVEFKDRISFQSCQYLVMELCASNLLDQIHVRNQKKKPFSNIQVFFMLEQLTSAMKYANGLKMEHRDIKPGNILIKGKYCFKLADFGFAKFVALTMKQTLQQSTEVGTPEYSAPEVLLKQNYGFNCDVWSLGVTAYQMITGTLAFSRNLRLGIPEQIRLFLKSDKLSNIPDRHMQFCLKNMLEWGFRNRWSFSEVQTQLTRMRRIYLPDDEEKSPTKACCGISLFPARKNQQKNVCFERENSQSPVENTKASKITQTQTTTLDKSYFKKQARLTLKQSITKDLVRRRLFRQFYEKCTRDFRLKPQYIPPHDGQAVTDMFIALTLAVCVHYDQKILSKCKRKAKNAGQLISRNQQDVGSSDSDNQEEEQFIKNTRSLVELSIYSFARIRDQILNCITSTVPHIETSRIESRQFLKQLFDQLSQDPSHRAYRIGKEAKQLWEKLFWAQCGISQIVQLPLFQAKLCYLAALITDLTDWVIQSNIHKGEAIAYKLIEHANTIQVQKILSELPQIKSRR